MSLAVPNDAPHWWRASAREIEGEIERQRAMDVFAVAGLPDAALFPYRWLFVPDETGGAVPCFSDGTNWRRCTDRTIAS